MTQNDEPTTISLRDYFAGEFAAAWVIVLSRGRDTLGYDDAACITDANRLGLMQADDMLKERERAQP